MAYDAATDRRIQRMSCQKVAVEVMAPFPVTSKGEPAAASENWKKVFSDLCDFLDADVNKAGQGVTVTPEPATVTPSNGTAQTLEEALAVVDRIKSKCADNEPLKGAIKLQFVKFGVKNPRGLEDAVAKLTKSQAAELEAYVDQEIER